MVEMDDQGGSLCIY